MLRKKTPPTTLKFALTVPKSLADRIERLRSTSEAMGYELDIDETLIRCLLGSATRWEKTLGIGSNAVPQRSQEVVGLLSGATDFSS